MNEMTEQQATGRPNFLRFSHSSDRDIFFYAQAKYLVTVMARTLLQIAKF